jgi:hypothetical protein
MFSVIEETGIKTLEMHSIHERLDQIWLYLEKEIDLKQKTIEGLEELVGKLEAQLLECRQTNEGTRQLINKLLNDISNYQKDIEWYKRTYVKRSLPGTIWQKLFRK